MSSASSLGIPLAVMQVEGLGTFLSLFDIELDTLLFSSTLHGRGRSSALEDLLQFRFPCFAV